jgi:hypothetical protein
MRKVYLKTIVSGSYELPYVLLNLYELKSICDEFWITEANRTHTGDDKDYAFKPYFDAHICDFFSTARYFQMDIAQDSIKWSDDNETDSVLRFNEYLTRSSFVKHIDVLSSRDIIISVDGDEVICNTIYLRLLINIMRFWPFKKPLAFVLTLRHFLFYVNLFMSKYDYYGPSISHVEFYKSQQYPNWRYGGRRIQKPFGCHFSWMLDTQGMRNKILSFAHRDRLRHLASLEVLESVKAGKYDLFEPNVDLSPILVPNYKSKLFPRSLSKVKPFLDKDLILDHKTFWT